METIRVKLMDVKFPAADADAREREAGKSRLFYVLTVNYEGNSLRAAGESIYRPNVNAVYDLTGDWALWNGMRQFRFKAMEEKIPMDSRGLLFYACERTTGFGEATAEAIWDALGEGWQSIREGDVPRVTAAKIGALMDTLETLELQREMTEAIVFLSQKGCTRKMAEAAWAKWGLGTIPKVNADCYVLSELPNYGFRAVDVAIRQNFGIADDDPRRIDACIRYTFGQMTDGGDTIVKWPLFWDTLCGTLQSVPAANVYSRVGNAFQSGKYVLFDGTDEITSQYLYGVESAIWEYAGRMQK